MKQETIVVRHLKKSYGQKNVTVKKMLQMTLVLLFIVVRSLQL